jgi:hypothetical protein
MAATYGAAGRLAAAFVDSKLTPLFIAASLALGALAVVALPREEEPQIIVPMVDVFVQMPGATPADVEQRVTRPMEQLLSEVPGVEYVYSTSSPGQSMVVVRFTVGQAEEAALVRLNQKLAANADRIPAGVIGPIVKPRSIDDVPIMAVTVWSERYGDDEMRALAAQLRDPSPRSPTSRKSPSSADVRGRCRWTSTRPGSPPTISTRWPFSGPFSPPTPAAPSPGRWRGGRSRVSTPATG